MDKKCEVSDINKEQLKEEIKNADVVFYMIYDGNRRLNKDDEMKICTKHAKNICAHSFLIRSGKNVQNVNSLLEEIELYGNDDLYCFIVLNTETMESIRLNNNDMKNIISTMKNNISCDNSGQLIKKYLDENPELTN